MTQRKRLITATIIGIVAFLLIVMYLRDRENELLLISERIPVLIATKDILKNTQLDETMLRRVKIPRKFVQPDAVENEQNAIGQIVSAPIKKGEQILKTKLLSYGSETGLTMKISPGLRAVSIAVNEVTGIAQLVRPNNFIDILATFDFGDRAQSKKYKNKLKKF